VQRSYQSIGIQKRKALADAGIVAIPNHAATRRRPMKKTGTKRPKRYHSALSGVKFFNREIQGVMEPHRSFQGCGRKSLW
jgi:hypothetical protein